MPTSEARIIANQQNALKSCGPKTSEGKERSRANSYKHGLTGRGVVTPAGDAEEIARRVEALEADLKPKSPIGEMMILRMATLSLRTERACEQESRAIAKNVRHAADDFDEERIGEADRLFESLGENPRTNLRRLRKMPEGVDLLLESWCELLVDLTRDTRPAWTAAHLERAANMIGVRGENARGIQIGVLSRGVWGDFGGLTEREGGNLDEEARQAWARARLVERIDAEIADLEAHRETLDYEMIELDRSEAGGRALFDPSKGAALARRYESEASRGFFKALKEFRQAESESAARAEASRALPPTAPMVPSRVEPEPSLGSIGDWPPPADREPSRASSEGSMIASPVVLDRDSQPFTVGRPAMTPG